MAKAVSYSESIPCLTLVDTNSETVSIYNKPSSKDSFSLGQVWLTVTYSTLDTSNFQGLGKICRDISSSR